MDPIAFHKSLSEMGQMFQTTMEEFEGKLHRSKSPSLDITSLTNEFTIFKSYVLKSLRTLQDQITMVGSEIDKLEMRGRRKILLVHGVPEVSQEDTVGVVVRTVSEKLKLSGFTKDSISRCHRMGRTTSDKPRPILCKLRDVEVRDQMWSSKTALKDTGVTISEFLTKTRHDTFMAARKRFGVTRCWTRQGFVFVLGHDGVRHRVSFMDELNKIPQVEVSAPKAATAATAAVTVKELAVPRARRAAATSRK